MTIKGETIWVTGASSGLGRELALRLAEAGNTVIASARNMEALRDLAEGFSNIHIFEFDVSQREQVSNIRASLEQRYSSIDRVILNAGTCEYFNVNKPDWSMIGRVSQVNFIGAVNTLEAVWGLLLAAPKPHIVGVGSQAVGAPFPRTQAYGASKAALHYFLESMRVDLQLLNVDVTLLKPGFVDTPLTQRNDFSMPFLWPPEKAAVKMLAAIEKRQRSYAFPLPLSLLLWFGRSFPRIWLRLMRPSVVADAAGD